MIQENFNIKVYLNDTEIEVTQTGYQYPPMKTKDGAFVYRYIVIIIILKH